MSEKRARQTRTKTAASARPHLVVRLSLEAVQVLQARAVVQAVKVDDVVVGVFFHQHDDHMGRDEASPPCDQNVLRGVGGGSSLRLLSSLPFSILACHRCSSKLLRDARLWMHAKLRIHTTRYNDARPCLLPLSPQNHGGGSGISSYDSKACILGVDTG